VYKQIEIKGSLGGNKDGLVVVLDLISEGKIAPTLEEIPFSEISQGFSRLESGQVDGRLFTRPNGTSSH
jgi:propanol-preferring alcohol dehydrogenase